jgi:DNA-binding winged helix-turn-helix (wHTH) protein
MEAPVSYLAPTRRAGSPPTGNLRFGAFELDLSLFEVRRDGCRIDFAPRSFDLLVFLARNRARVVSSEELLHALWPGIVVGATAIRRLVSELRAALPDTAPEPSIIVTVRGRGYRFAPPLEPAAAVDPPSVPALAITPVTPAPEVPPTDDRRMERRVLAARDQRTAPASTALPRPARTLGNLPPLPRIAIGRDRELAALVALLCHPSTTGAGQGAPGTTAVLHGWAGVGKSVLAALAARDAKTRAAFPDGVLWHRCGLAGNARRGLAAWARATDAAQGDELERRPEELALRISRQLYDKRMLLVVDDAWSADIVEIFRVGGAGCRVLVTTRLASIGDAVATERDVLAVRGLGSEDAVALLESLAPATVARHPTVCAELLSAAGTLPIAVHVLAVALRAARRHGLSEEALLHAARHDPRWWVAAPSPPDVAVQGFPTLQAALEPSLSALSEAALTFYAELARIAAPGNIVDVARARELDDSPDDARALGELLDHGLLEQADERSFRLHPLLRSALAAASSIRSEVA